MDYIATAMERDDNRMKGLKDTAAFEEISGKINGGRIKIGVYNLSEYILRVAGFFLARAMPISGVAPFGLAFMTLERSFSVKSIVSIAGVVAGYLTLGVKAALGYIISAVLFSVILYFVSKEKEIELKKAVMVMSFILGLTNIGGLLWLGFNFENVIMAVLDIGFLILGSMVFDKCRVYLNGKNLRRDIPTGDEKICLCVMVGIILVGFRDVRVINNYSLANTLGFLIIGISGASGGLLGGTITGIITGFLLGVKGDVLTYLGVFSLTGLVCGICSKYNKYVVAAGLLVSGMLISSYSMGNGNEFIRFYEVPVAALMVAFIPDNTYNFISKFTNFSKVSIEEGNPYKLYVRTKLALASESFKNLAETFEKISENEKMADMRDIDILFDTAADRVCSSCSEVNRCWKREYKSTYKVMFRFFEILEKKRMLTEKDADHDFSSHCLRLKQLVNELNKQFEIYKLNLVWRSKLCENRELVGEQFSGVAEILNKISKELDSDSSFDNMAAEEIRCRMRVKGIKCDNVQVSQDFEGRHRISLCTKNQEPLRNDEIQSVLKSVLGAEFSCQRSQDKGRGKILQYHEVPVMKIEAGYVGCGKGEECGDSHNISNLRGGKYIAVLSDGMGTGSRAGKESSAIVELLEGFMDAGFDRKVAVKLVNSAMVMKSTKEAFATVDMCIIDLYTGEAEFIKNGAEPSYIKRKNGTETVRSASLPVGIMPGVEIESFAHKLSEGDTIVMVSDGLEVRNGNNGWLRKTVEDAEDDIPVQKLAEQIVDKSVALQGGTADDDMTVIVLRVAG